MHFQPESALLYLVLSHYPQKNMRNLKPRPRQLASAVPKLHLRSTEKAAVKIHAQVQPKPYPSTVQVRKKPYPSTVQVRKKPYPKYGPSTEKTVPKYGPSTEKTVTQVRKKPSGGHVSVYPIRTTRPPRGGRRKNRTQIVTKPYTQVRITPLCGIHQ